MDDWYLHNLVCPRDYRELSEANDKLKCPKGHTYPIVDEIPVMLIEEAKQTMEIAESSIKRSKGIILDKRAPHFYLESLGLSEDEKRGIIQLDKEKKSDVDPVVSYIIGATCGYLYKHLIGRLESYPIPELRLPNGNGRTLLDIGCNWGRWCIAAYRKGYNVVGLDPSLGAIMAAKRVNKQLGLSIKYLVADARWLPFRENSFDNIFSYSVLQHLDRNNVETVLPEIARVLKHQGRSSIQMANLLGLRCLFHQARRHFKEADSFKVRYWSIPSLKKTFSAKIGKTSLSIDCFWGLGLQSSDSRLMPLSLKIVIFLSELMRKTSQYIPFFIYIADSVYVNSVCHKQ